MKNRICIIFFICCSLISYIHVFANPKQVETPKPDQEEQRGIYLYEEHTDPTQEDPMVWVGVSIGTALTEKEQIQRTINNLFHWTPAEPSTQNQYSYIPEGTQLIECILVEDECNINVSKEMTHYGGTHWEAKLVDQLLATLFTFPTIESITLYIEGQETYLPEGTELQQYKRSEWQKRRNKEGWNDSINGNMTNLEMSK